MFLFVEVADNFVDFLLHIPIIVIEFLRVRYWNLLYLILCVGGTDTLGHFAFIAESIVFFYCLAG